MKEETLISHQRESSESESAIGGYESAKSALREVLLLPRTHPHLFTSLGISAPSGIRLKRTNEKERNMLYRSLNVMSLPYFSYFLFSLGVLLKGPAGVGKTALVYQMAKEVIIKKKKRKRRSRRRRGMNKKNKKEKKEKGWRPRRITALNHRLALLTSV
jgi:hypothetical protein